MDNALFIGSTWVVLDEIDSTNNYALGLLQQGEAMAALPLEGTVVMAKHQTSGRGMRGNNWHSDRGAGLAMSVILYPTFLPLSRQFFLSQCVALGVCQWINDIMAQKVCCQIKWPNDIYVGTLKLGGILIDNNVQNGQLAASIVGIGININQKEFPAFLANPTSLYQLTGLHYDISALSKKLCHYLEKWYLLLKADKLSVIKAAYLENLYRYGQYARYRHGNTDIIARITDVAENGFLQLQLLSDGEQRLFDLKEISYVFE